jgi:hypothetical protein
MFRNRVYYTLKPWLPARLRLAARRWFARRIRRGTAESWPILEEAGRAPEGWPGWPDGRKFALVLTHDVEGARGVGRVRQLAELENALGFRSSFNFVPEGEYQTPEELRHWLTDQGFEVGVQDLNHDGWLYRSRESFREKAAAINRYLREWSAVGFRSGLMHHNLEWLKDIDALYDASTFDTDPFEPQPDGVRTVFPFWVPRADGGGYVELPYSLVQDYNLFVVLQEKSSDIWKQKLEWIAARGGMALLIVHPDYVGLPGAALAADEFPVALYEEFLRHVKERYAGQYWQALPREVAQHVKRHKHGCRHPNLPLPPVPFSSAPAVPERNGAPAPPRAPQPVEIPGHVRS